MLDANDLFIKIDSKKIDDTLISAMSNKKRLEDFYNCIKTHDHLDDFNHESKNSNIKKIIPNV